MSSNWSQEGQPQMGGNSMQQSSAPVRRSTNPPPVCFNCGGEHFLVDCPTSRTSNTVSGFAPAPAPYQQTPGPAPPPQQFPQGGPSQYPSYPPNQQYVPPAAQYQYNQPPQPYTAPAPAPYVAPPSNPQYSRPGYQPPSYNQNNGIPQYTAAAYQTPNPQYNARGPSPYQAPVSNYQPQTTGYRGGYQSAPTSGPYQPPPQWNSTPSASQAPFQKASRNNVNFQREFSGAPSYHSQQQQHRQPSRSQSLQLEHPIKTPQTPSSQGLQGSPAKPPIPSIPSTPASHSEIRRGSTATVNVVIPKSELKAASAKVKAEETLEQETEEGEVREGDDEEELFDWDFQQIFKEPPAAETVALAQPLSAGYESTPVPLVQAWSTSVPSISRYARKDNLKEFIKSVRVAPQWSYLQEDPAFAELGDDGEAIPLNQIGVWMDIHHGRTVIIEGVEELEPISKKRSRPESEIREQENQQEDVDHQIALEAATEQEHEEPPNKRQKNDEIDDYDVIMRSSGNRTPIIVGRGGTPCLATTDDAWAPQPGETATSPGDPTESLLASLGVSGDPKPPKQGSLPPHVSKEEYSHSPPQSHTQTSLPSQPHFQGPNPKVSSKASGPNAQAVPPNHGRQMAPGPQSDPQYGPPMPYANGTMPNTPYSQGPQPNASQVPQGYPQGYSQGPLQGYSQGPQVNPQYGPAINAPYGTGPPQNMHGAPQYGPPVNTQSNGPPNNYPQGPQQWGPQRNPSFGTVPPYAPQQYPQYPPTQNPNYGNTNYGPPSNQYPSVAPAQYPQGPPQYNQARQTSYGSGPPMGGQYGPMAQNSPTQYGPAQYGQPQNGPPQNVPYNAGQYPNQPQYQNGPVNGYGNGPPQGPTNNAPYANVPPNSNMPANQIQYGNLPNGHAPPRQDSGYASARGSYSNGSGSNVFNNQGVPQNPTHPPNPQPPQGQPFSDATNQQSPKARPQDSDNKVKVERLVNAESSENSNASLGSNENGGSSPGTPLSPTSAEILGKLERKSTKGKPSKPTRASLSRKVKKKPQPVVEEAYSRRW